MKPLDEIETFKGYLDEYILHDELLTQLYNSLTEKGSWFINGDGSGHGCNQIGLLPSY